MDLMLFQQQITTTPEPEPDPRFRVLYSNEFMSPNDNSIEPEPDINTFSIRQYVLASRQKDILRNWPFPVKYLQICFKHGINNVLPPLDEPRDSAIQSLRAGVRFNCFEQDNEKANSTENIVGQENFLRDECDSYFNEALSKVSSQDCHLSLSSNSYMLEENNQLTSDISSDIIVPMVQPSTTMPSSHLYVDPDSKSPTSSKRLRHKRKRHKGKHKKRSMVDILSVAKHCTMEDLRRINRILGCGSAKTPEHRDEGNGGIAHVKHNCESELTDECLDKKLQNDDCEAANENTLSLKRWVVKFKFSGCKPNS